VVIWAIADHAAIDAARNAVYPKPVVAQTTSKPQRRPGSPALLLGHGAIPSAVMAEAIHNGAVIKPIPIPGAEPEPRYRPSEALAAFVRLRDLFCRFPGCTVSAERCDIDHVRPWPYGPTHASNLSCKCRGHHLMKTFYIGPGGWSDEQRPDGTVIWTAPSGRTYTTQPGSRLFFPDWDVTTAALPPPTGPPPPLEPGRGLQMPRRKQTRAAAVAAAIKAERELNRRDIAPF
jgi:hypothetical protein